MPISIIIIRKKLQTIKKSNRIILSIIALIYFGDIFCVSLNHFTTKNGAENNGENKFVGSLSCQPCHADVYQSYIHTAHYFTSRPASKESIKGSFDSGKNKYVYNQFMLVQMDNVGDSFYQTAMVNGVPIESEPFDIAVGSGRKGQTYLFWNDNKLFQLPVSYYTALNSWCNSPGYPSTLSSFSRQINGQCLECHGTNANIEVTQSNGTLFDKSSVIYGIECERCHGAAAQHVAYYKAHPTDTVAKYIIATKYLTRQQKLDACAFCHSGARKEKQPPFSFQVGDKLDDFSSPNYNTDSTAMLDVHGNQYGLLSASKCFQMSQMDCSSCHNVHQTERNVMQTFSQRCMNCHTDAAHNTCTFQPPKGIKLSENCVDCHMPLLPSKKIFLQLADKRQSTADFVRMHRIAIYPKETKEYVEKMTRKNG